MLKCLRISDGGTASFIIKNQPSLVEADIDTVFSLTTERLLQVANEIQKRDMVRDFLVGISKVIYDYARYVQLPVFRNLYTLCVRFNSYMWEMLPDFLELCPNLKTLVVGTSENPKMVDLTVIARPWNLLSSLEHVDIERPLKGEALRMALVGYLLENSPNLKKLSLSLHDSLKKGKSVHKLTLSLDNAPKKKESDIFIELLNFPRLSSSCQIIIFLNLPTKDVVQTSALSTRWTTLWKDVSGLDLDAEDFYIRETFVSFVDNFLERNHGLSIHRFKLKYDSFYFEEPAGLINGWVDTAARLKVEHLDVSDSFSEWDPMMNPTVLYTCSNLVSLRLVGMGLPNPECVSLPSLKTLVLILVEFTNKWALENFISKCPVLENFCFERSYDDGIPILRVHSKSLLTFMHDAGYHEDYEEEDRFVEIDAPMLKCLKISDDRTSSFIIKSPPSVVEADIDTVFNLTSERSLGIANEVQKREMVRDFLVGISKVKDMSISSSALEVIYDYSRYVQLPVFRNLYTLRVRFDSYMWEMLPVFLEVCPNLKTLVVGTSENPKMVDLTVITRPWNMLSSLEYVDIERPLKGEALEMTLVGYLLENSPNLKKLSLSLHDSLKKGESVHS
ncbi:hypothetical protein IGI04_023830 [Brassica rapa subsp. trilocularis]|uniref:FBD domain-containing protein n=1 Tax=Brassica rapa subsp. trilocularis TaxID=1813537 RepID=A0ABQ7M5M5_BRACM|nr:hypothetical protein IGI04_023830 [Brassica rapa subsp. trilocularis]